MRGANAQYRARKEWMAKQKKGASIARTGSQARRTSPVAKNPATKTKNGKAINASVEGQKIN